MEELVAERARKGLGGKVPVMSPSWKRRLDTAEKEAAEATKKLAALSLKWAWLKVNAGP